MTGPAYMMTLQYFLNHGVNFLAVPQDDQGLDTDYPAERMATLAANSEAMPKLLSTFPAFITRPGLRWR